jgi:hypothetical protein
MADDDTVDGKVVNEACRYIDALRKQLTGVRVAHKMEGYKFSVLADVDPFGIDGLWRFIKKLIHTWGPFFILLMGNDAIAEDFERQRLATQKAYACLREPSAREKGRGFSVRGDPRGLPRDEPQPSAAPGAGGEGKFEREFADEEASRSGFASAAQYEKPSFSHPTGGRGSHCLLKN